MLSAAELTKMRAESAKWFDAACVRSRAVRSDDGMGGFTTASTTTATYSCRCMPEDLAQGEDPRAMGVRGMATYKVVLPYDADVVPTDAVAVGGKSMEVLSVDGARSTRVTLVARCAVLA